MRTLYNLHLEGSDYRITKFVDGEVESSYLTSVAECECPAGHRTSCRHRQMLPQMLAEGIVNTHWFYDFNLHRVVDFSGTLKSNYDALNELAAKADADGIEIEDEDEDEVGHQIEAVGKGPEPAGPLDLTATEIDQRMAAMPPMQDAITEAIVDRIHELVTRKSWRRL